MIALPAIAGAIVYGLQRTHGLPPSDTIGVALLAGFIGWIATNLLFSAVQSWRERASIVNGMAGTEPVDGRQAVLVGHIEPLGAGLAGPFSGAECVAYKF